MELEMRFQFSSYISLLYLWGYFLGNFFSLWVLYVRCEKYSHILSDAYYHHSPAASTMSRVVSNSSIECDVDSIWEIKSFNSSQPVIQDLQRGHAQKTSIIGGKGTWFFGLTHSNLDYDDDERSEKCAHNEQKMNVTARKKISRADVNYMRFRKISQERSRFILLFTFFTSRKREISNNETIPFNSYLHTLLCLCECLKMSWMKVSFS